MDNGVHKLAQECDRLAQSCLYNATSLLIWSRHLRLVRGVFFVVPVILGSLSGSVLLLQIQPPYRDAIAAALAYLAGVLPPIYYMLDFDNSLYQARRWSGEFKAYENRFRLLAASAGFKSSDAFEQEFRSLLARYEEVRKENVVVPEWCFHAAQKKVHAGHYAPDERPAPL